LEGRETFLREQAMARQFDVSTTTVREAFHRLAGEGIIEHVPRRGWRLRPHAQKDMDDFVAVRQALEALALVCGWEATQSPDGRTVMEGFLARNTADGNPGGSPQIDDGFHAWIVEAAGNRYIRDILTRFGRYYRFLFEWEAADRAAGMQTVQQHRRILEAILQGDMPRARAALEAHLRYEHPLLKRVMKLPQLEIET
jgi:DNA-binding GntR family transcriptional regulator